MSVSRVIRFGLNYVPSRRWYYCWNDWERDAIARDFDAIAALGVDHLRVQLIWPWFQPNPSVVSEAHLARLSELMDLAAERRLDVFLCLLTGWLSGYRFLPPDVEARDIFLKEEVFHRCGIFFSAVADVVRKRENFLGFDLGNEINVIAGDLSVQAGDAWGKKITHRLRQLVLPHHWIVNGTDHQPWFRGKTFSAEHLARDYDAVTIHAWPKFTGCLQRGGLADPPSLHLARFLCLLASRFAAPSSRPLWIQEFGCSGLWGSPAEQIRYMEATVSLAAMSGVAVFTWWCSHDIDPAYRFDPLEYDLGLLTTANQRKPLADVYARLIGEYAHFASLDTSDLAWIPSGFQPGPSHESTLSSSTWQLFDRYLSHQPGS